MPRIHPYHNGYSVLPGMRKIRREDIFPNSAFDQQQYEQTLLAKRQAMKSQRYEFVDQLPTGFEAHAAEFIHSLYPTPLPETKSFSELIPQLQEDIIVHCLDDQRDWMAYGHVCLPSGWLPEEKIGRSFHEIHIPVAGMDLSKSRQMVEMIIQRGPFERFVWSIVFEDKLNFHPSQPKQRFHLESPVLFVKVERQVTIGFPEFNSVLFILSQSLIPENEIDKPALHSALSNMTRGEILYKGIEGDIDDVLRYLSVC